MPVKNYQYSVGCDPEVFVVNGEGQYVSAHDLIPGTKHNPTPVPYGAVQPDGTAAEFNIEPAYTAAEFTYNIKTVLQELQDMIIAMHPEYRLRVTPTAWFDKIYFTNLPATALAFGCEPDFSAYSGKMNVFKGTKDPFRTGAGHLHIGWTQDEDIRDTAHLFDCREAVKQMDSVLYPLSLLWDDDEHRRTLYGKLGSFRPKPFGVEYRPLSNVWVSDPELHEWIFDTATHAMALLDEGGQALYDKKETNDLFFNYDAAKREGKKLSRNELIKHHDWLVFQYGFQELPDRYLAAA